VDDNTISSSHNNAYLTEFIPKKEGFDTTTVIEFLEMLLKQLKKNHNFRH